MVKLTKVLHHHQSVFNWKKLKTLIYNFFFLSFFRIALLLAKLRKVLHHSQSTLSFKILRHWSSTCLFKKSNHNLFQNSLATNKRNKSPLSLQFFHYVSRVAFCKNLFFSEKKSLHRLQLLNKKTNYLLSWHFLLWTDFFQFILNIFFCAIRVGRYIEENVSQNINFNFIHFMRLVILFSPARMIQRFCKFQNYLSLFTLNVVICYKILKILCFAFQSYVIKAHGISRCCTCFTVIFQLQKYFYSTLNQQSSSEIRIIFILLFFRIDPGA